MSLFGAGKFLLLSNYPGLLRIAARIHNAIFLNKIRGRRGNKIVSDSAFLKKVRICIHGTNNEIVFGEKCRINETAITINGSNNKILIGSRTLINHGNLWMEDDGGEIHIGENSKLCGPTHLAVIEGKKIIIGEECLFSSDTVLRTGDSHSVLDLSGKRINPSKDVVLGDRIWLGHRAIISKGTIIPSDSIIASSAIVTHAFTENHIVLGGVPAKIIRHGVSWSYKRIPLSDE